MFFSTLDSLKNLLGWHATRSLHWVKCRVSLCWSSPGTSWRVSWWNWSRNSLGKRASHLDSDHTNLWKCVGKQCWSISWYVVVNYRMILLLQLPKFRNIKLHRCIFSKHFLRNLMDQTKSMSQHISNPKFSNQIEKNEKYGHFMAFCQTLSALLLLYPCLKVSAGHLSRTTSRILAKSRCASETGNGRFCDYNYGDFTENFRDLTEAEWNV